MLTVVDREVGYRLANAEDRHAQPPPARGSLRAGDRAQLLFELVPPDAGNPEAERLWVEVTGKRQGRYVGALTSTPRAITSISRGDLVEFGPEHVISIEEDWPLREKRIFVSRRSHERAVRPGFVYREDPDDERDSGWRALVGDESHDEVDDPDNALLQDVGFVLDRWPELRPVFETDPANGEWAWDEESERYVPAPQAGRA